MKPARLEAALLALGFAFQLFAAAALLLSPAVSAGARPLSPGAFAAFLPPLVWAGAAWLLHREFERRIPNRDPLLFPAAMFLAGWGLQILVRLSPGTALRQTLWLALICAALLALLRLPGDLEWFRKYRYLWLGGALAALAATLVVGIGATENSPRLWLGLDGVYFQPSEFLRWIFPVFAAFTLAPRADPAGAPSAKQALPVLLFGAAGVGLHVLQQDLGAAMLLLGAAVLVLYLAYRKAWILLLGAAIVAGVLGAGSAFNPTVQTRIATWWNPWLDPSNTSYQVVQSLIAVASGGLIGRGPGLGAPSLVPVAYSDFVFTALSEEYGVLGATGCLLVIAVLVLRGLRTAVRSGDPAARIIAASLSSLLGMQSILIIAGGLRLLPLTGVTLPWMSYGGSSLLSSAVMLGMLLILSDRAPQSAPCPRPDRPVRVLSAVFLLGFAAAGVSLGWWGIYRAPVLRVRSDNYRRMLHDQQARRGDLFDRNGKPLAVTAGVPGAYTRQYPDPAAAPVVGFTTAYYGQGGMEAALDSWLREAGRDDFQLWWSETVLGIPLSGADARLTIDSLLQDRGSGWIRGRLGAAVVLRAVSGEILALVSAPTFDPATLADDYEELAHDPAAPLLNRATQGLYAPGKMLLPFVAAEALDRNLFAGDADLCSAPAVAWMTSAPDFPDQVLTMFRFNQDPALELPTANVPSLSLPADPIRIEAELEGRGSVLVSPLQLALAFASLAAEGMAPAPRLVAGLQSAGGWVTPDPAGHPTAMVPAGTARRIRGLLAASGPNREWYGCGATATGGGISWYAGFPTLGEDPVVVVVALEGLPAQAIETGRLLLAYADALGY